MSNRPELRANVAQELSPYLLTSVRLLQMDMASLSDYMLEMAEQNPALEIAPPAAGRRDAPAFSRGSYTKSGRRTGSAADIMAATENVGCAEDPLENLHQQVRLLGLCARDEIGCLMIVDSLDERGFFPREIAEFARDTGMPETRAARCLNAVRTLEPAGIGAHDLADCLLLQLKRSGADDPLLETVIRNHLMDVCKRGYARIARQTGATIPQVKACAESISRLNPRPCDLSQQRVTYITPDYAVEIDENGKFSVVHYDDCYPSLRFDRDFIESTRGLTGDDRDFVRKMTVSARQIIRAVEMRRNTMDRLLTLIVREQCGFSRGSARCCRFDMTRWRRRLAFTKARSTARLPTSTCTAGGARSLFRTFSRSPADRLSAKPAQRS